MPAWMLRTFDSTIKSLVSVSPVRMMNCGTTTAMMTLKTSSTPTTARTTMPQVGNLCAPGRRTAAAAGATREAGFPPVSQWSTLSSTGLTGFRNCPTQAKTGLERATVIAFNISGEAMGFPVRSGGAEH